ncbi:MAG TPA: hypothetical protein VJK51_02135 [Candidatus Nanoarchaeia archaeon]|nr:hypothetical protein [Candidatus Nanoarchaeia archaeon]
MTYYYSFRRVAGLTSPPSLGIITFGNDLLFQGAWDDPIKPSLKIVRGYIQSEIDGSEIRFVHYPQGARKAHILYYLSKDSAGIQGVYSGRSISLVNPFVIDQSSIKVTLKLIDVKDTSLGSCLEQLSLSFTFVQKTP